MRFASRHVAAALAPLLLAACVSASAPEPVAAEPQPVALRVTLTGRTAAVLGEGAAGQVEILREGEEAPVAVVFENGALAVADLAPGRYSIRRIGPLQCRGLGFEVDPVASARALGSMEVEIIETEYYVGLMAVRPADAGDIGALAARAGAAPESVDADPLDPPEGAPCFVNRNGPDATWQDIPLHQRILLGVAIAGLCAASVVAGGFCVFGAGGGGIGL